MSRAVKEKFAEHEEKRTRLEERVMRLEMDKMNREEDQTDPYENWAHTMIDTIHGRPSRNTESGFQTGEIPK